MVRAKILFFDSNPIGRIFTRFSKDVKTLDSKVPNMSSNFFYTTLRTISVFATVVAIYPIMLIAILFVMFLMVIVLRFGISPQRECIRMDSIFRGPINSSFAMIVNGLVTVRSYERITFFRKQFINQLEKSSNASFSHTSINRWIALSLDYICTMFALIGASFAVFSGDSLSIELRVFSI